MSSRFCCIANPIPAEFEINILHRLLILFWKALVLILGRGASLRWRSQMTDLHENSDPKYTAQIDTVGWIFVVFAVAITVIAAVVAYLGRGTMMANTPVSHVAGSPG
jgi:hypothetical protein